jgi:hypothetical protein
MFFVEDKNFLTDEQKNFIEDHILGQRDFTYFFQPSSAEGDGCAGLSHFAIRRPEQRTDKDEYYNSAYAIDLEKILRHFCKKNKININEILRIAVNLSFNNGCKSCNIHLDHPYPHKQLLVYLND